MTTMTCWNCATRTEVDHGDRRIMDLMWYVRCPSCKVLCVVAFPDTAPNGEPSIGALEAAGDTSAPVAAPVVNDCRDCRHWEPDVMDDYSDSARGVCKSLRMVTTAKAGGCSYSYVRDRRRNGRR